MHFSSKITSSLLTYFDRLGLNMEELYSSTDVPTEFLRDPASWIEASKMEQFLLRADQIYRSESCLNEALDTGELSLMESVGHKASELHSWGVLDGVLRMVTRSQEVFHHPERFLSYFIAPEPPVRIVDKSEGTLVLEIPISNTEFPLVTEYLGAALEALPTFSGKNLANVNWRANQIKVRWEDPQEDLVGFDGDNTNISPQMLQNLIGSLEASQKQLEAKNRELMEKNKKLSDAQKELQVHFKERVFSEKLSGLEDLAAGVAHEINNPLAYTMSNLHRLTDYFVRAQQLITLLVGQDRMSNQVQKAMKRVDWEFISKEFPQVAGEARVGLDKVKSIVQDLSFLSGKKSKEGENKIPTDINQVVDEAVKLLQPNVSSRITIDRHFDLTSQIPTYPERMEQALVNLIQNAIQSIDSDGTVRIWTRSRGQRAEIEISDTGMGMDRATVDSIFTPYFTTKSPGNGTGLGLTIAHSIVEMHNGSIAVESEPGQGSTFRVELPL